MEKQDISLLFGVMGGGSLSGESGKLIQSQLTQIMSELNQNPLKVKIGIDISSGEKKSWSSQLQQELDKISASGKFSAQISTLKLSAGAVNDFKKQLEAIVNTLGLSSGTEIIISSKGIGEIKNELKQVSEAAKDTKQNLSNLDSQAKNIGKMPQNTNWVNLLKRISDTATQARRILDANINASGTAANSSSYQNLRNGLSLLDNILLSCAGDADKLQNALSGINIDDVISRTNTAISTLRNELEKTGASGTITLRQLTDTAAQMQTILNKNPQMRGSEAFENLKKQVAVFQSVITACNNQAEYLGKALRSAGLDGATAIENAKSAISAMKNELASTEANVGNTSAFQRASQAVKEYYGLLLKVSQKNNDIVLTPDGWRSVSGNYTEMASALNKAASAYRELTSESSRSKMSNNELVALTQLLAQKERDLALAVEERANKQRAAVHESSKENAAFNTQIKALTQQKEAVKRSIDNLTKRSASEGEKERISEIISRYEQWAAKIEEVRTAKKAATEVRRAEIEAEGAAIAKNVELINQERTKRELQERKNEALKSSLRLLTQMQDAERNWSAAKNGSSKDSYAGIQNDIGRLKEYRKQLDAGVITLETFQRKLDRIRSSFAMNSAAIKNAGENTKSFTSRLGSLAQKFTAWLSVSRVIMLVVRSIRRMISATIELDDAMTQLKIVTHETNQEYQKYLENISKTASKIGSSISSLVDSATTYARLGYNLKESSALAEYTAMLQNVGDIDVSDAQSAVTSIVKAFGISVDEIESVMDKLVATGNSFPISVSEIAEGMTNASSALAAAGNTFDQSVALLTAANTTIQDASKASTGLRTISARIRKTKTELEELGETMTEATYDGLIAALTKYNVSLTDINGEFRSTYDIISDIAKVWDSLSSMEQAGIAEAIAGTRQQAVFYSLVGQFQEASGAMEAMSNSAGTLNESYNTFMDSTTAHINQFKAAFQSLGEAAFPAKFLSSMADLGTGILKAMECLVKLVNVVGDLNTLLPVTIGLIAALNFSKMPDLFMKFLALISHIKAIILDTTFAKGISAIQAGLAMLKTGSEAATSAFIMMGGSMSIMTTVITGIVAAISIGVIVFKKFRKSTEELVDSSNALKESFREFKDTSEKNIKTLRGMSEEFEHLSQGVDQYGRNISLSADDYDRYRQMIEQIVGISPELIAGYDEENEYLVDKNRLLERAIELQEQEYQNELRRKSLTPQLSEAIAGPAAEYTDLIEKKEAPALRVINDALFDTFNPKQRGNIHKDMTGGEFLARQIIDALGIDVAEEELQEYFDKATYWEYHNFLNRYMDKIAEDLQSGHSRILDQIRIAGPDGLGFRSRDDLELAVEQLKTAAAEYMDVQKQISQANQNTSEELRVVAESNERYKELSGGAKQIVSDFVDSFGVEETSKRDLLGRFTPDKEMLSKVKTQINDFVESLTPEIQEIIDEGMALKLNFDEEGNEISVKEYRNRVDDVLTRIEEDIDDEELKLHIRTSLNIDEDSTSINGEVEKAIAHIQEILVDPSINRSKLEGLLNAYKEEISAAEELGVDLSRTVYGNIDTNNRQVLEWTEENLNTYKDAIESWGSTIDEMRGYVSTIFGGSENFDGVEIAFSPMLQTENGAVLLNSNTVYEYIQGLIDRAGDGWNNEDLLRLDTEGLEFDGRVVKNLLADIGDTAIQTGEAMHFTGSTGGVQMAYDDLSAAAADAGLSVEELNRAIESGDFSNLRTVQEIVDDLSVDEVLQIYYNISASPHSMTLEELRDKLVATAPNTAVADLAETAANLQAAYTLLKSAQEEMASEDTAMSAGGLSAETIQKLAEAEENYLDYLYEENGVVKLNTEAWRENANAKMSGEIEKIQKEIWSLKEQNGALRENLAYYEEQHKLGNDGALWSNLIAQTTADIEENSRAIEENQGKLAIYSSLYGSITGDIDAYTSALQNFSNVANTIDTISGSFQTLANLQAEVANGFTISLNKALEFAKVYPEILDNAQVTADGQIVLNEGIVNSFIDGKKAELDAQVDAETAKLEADREVLQAKIAAAQAQLETAKSVGEGEGKISKEVADYRIRASNEMVKALINNGIDEASAYKAAAAAMSSNAEEFDRVAAEVCRDVDGNFNSAAYNAAMSIYENMEQAKIDIASVATQAHESGKAIRAMVAGRTDGSNSKVNGSGGGKKRKAISTKTTSGEFNGFDYDFNFKGASLDEFVSQVELDISSYQKAIGQINGQIAALQALKNAPLKNFKSGSGKGAGSKSGSGSEKEIEEYIADIDDYREALERLRIAQKATADVQREIDQAADMRIVSQDDIDLLQAENKRLNERNDLLEDALGAIEYYSEVQKDLVNKNIDTGRTVFGNIDLNNRQVLEWTENTLSVFQDAIESWGKNAGDLIGSVSTVFGGWDEFDGIPIAYSPMLQTENGAVLLNADTVHRYIWGLIEKAGEGWRSEDLFCLDTAGLEIDGIAIKNLLADIGDTAEKTAESMHFLGTDGAVNASYREISEAADTLGISVEELLQQYDKLNAEMDQNGILLEQNAAALQAAESAATSRSDMMRQEIALQQKLIGTYIEQQAALENLNHLKDSTISAGAQKLRDLGFTVSYDAETDDLWISNMERLNELTADNAGKYDTLQEAQEATNELRKETEELIETITKLNDENRESGENWLNLKDSIKEAKKKVVSLLGEIVTAANDAVDEIQKVYDTLKEAADEYAKSGGFISVDTFQSILELGPQYMQYLRDENGLLVINEENINRVIEAKTRQLAAESALTYVERLHLALQDDAVENLNTLLYATTDATNATFGLAYAELELMRDMGDLNDAQYEAALHNIQSIEALANTAVVSIGKTSEEYSETLKNMKDGMDDILKYVMDMLKHRIQQKIDALEEMKTAYGELIDLRKEALDTAKKEAEYEDTVAEKVKQIAKLQERINALSLDDSRDAQAQKLKLEEEMADIQKELSDTQSDYAVEAQKEALDDMQEAYEKEKDQEIKTLEETISSYQKCYDMAIRYIQENWDTLYTELLEEQTTPYAQKCA